MSGERERGQIRRQTPVFDRLRLRVPMYALDLRMVARTHRVKASRARQGRVKRVLTRKCVPVCNLVCLSEAANAHDTTIKIPLVSADPHAWCRSCPFPSPPFILLSRHPGEGQFVAQRLGARASAEQSCSSGSRGQSPQSGGRFVSRREGSCHRAAAGCQRCAPVHGTHVLVKGVRTPVVNC